ncbi:hypothetical protein HYH02_000469 [Chlamydomonas schloesseri]|uniref:Protein kinase domain-containing protein n=1 Tax=Chlamydomonas schloesseri TaxID=2026947 RepID=A0A836BCW1_9CHLO|nr:hypothetical protein HYH02_000469 [Chlamydomonas schloesseri]|eukprot:KAG2454628.1 hypothetical protein HYH02_000469 [Chlamydomonas schloesseri]
MNVRRHAVTAEQRVFQGDAAAAGLTESASDAGPAGLSIPHGQLLCPAQLSSGPMDPRTLSTGGVQLASRSPRNSADGGAVAAVMAAAAASSAPRTASSAAAVAAAITSSHLHPMTRQLQVHSAAEQHGTEDTAAGSAGAAAQLLQPPALMAVSALQQAAATAAFGAITVGLGTALAAAPSAAGAHDGDGVHGNGTASAVSSSAAATVLMGASTRPSTSTCISTGSSTTLRTLLSRATTTTLPHNFYASSFAAPSRQQLLHSCCSASLLHHPQQLPPDSSSLQAAFEGHSAAALPMPRGGGGGGGGGPVASKTIASLASRSFALDAPTPSAFTPAAAPAAAAAAAAGAGPHDEGANAGGISHTEVVDCDSSSTHRLRQLQLIQLHQQQRSLLQQHNSQHALHLQHQHEHQHQHHPGAAACRSPAASAIISGILPSILSRNSSVHSACATPAPPSGGGGSFATAAAATAAMSHSQSRLLDSPGSFNASPVVGSYAIQASNGSRLLTPEAVVAAAAAAAAAAQAGVGAGLTPFRSATYAAGAVPPSGQQHAGSTIYSRRPLTQAEVVLAEANAVVMSACLPDYPPGGGPRQSSSSSCPSGGVARGGIDPSPMQSADVSAPNPSTAAAQITAGAGPLSGQAHAAGRSVAAVARTDATAAAAATAAPCSAGHSSPFAFPVRTAFGDGAGTTTPSGCGGGGGGAAVIAAGTAATALAPLPEMPPLPPAAAALAGSPAAAQRRYTSAAKMLTAQMPPQLPHGLLGMGAAPAGQPSPMPVTLPLMLADANTAAALVSNDGASGDHGRGNNAAAAMHCNSSLRLDQSLQLETAGSIFASTSCASGDIAAAAVAALSRPPTAGTVLSNRSLRPATASVCAVPGTLPAARPAVRLASSADVQLPWHMAARQQPPQQQHGCDGSPRELRPPPGMPVHLQLSGGGGGLQQVVAAERVLLCSRNQHHDESPPSQPLPLPTAANAADTILRITDLDTCWAELRDLSFLGSGACGNVYTGTWCGMPVAAKFMISGSVDQLQRQQREAALSRLASHPHLVQTYAIATAQLLPAHFRGEHGGCCGGGSGSAHAACFSEVLSQGVDHLLGTACGTDGMDLYGTNPCNAISTSNHQHPHIASAAALSRCASSMRASGTSGMFAVTATLLAPLAQQSTAAGAQAFGSHQQHLQQASACSRAALALKPNISPFAQQPAAAGASSSRAPSSDSSGSSSGSGSSSSSGDNKSAGGATTESGSSPRITAMLAAGAQGDAAGDRSVHESEPKERTSDRRGTAIGIEIAARSDPVSAAGGTMDSGVEMFSASSLADAVDSAAAPAAGFRGFGWAAAAAAVVAAPASTPLVVGNSPTTVRPRQQQPQQQQQQQRLHTILLGAAAHSRRPQHHNNAPGAGDAAGSSPAAAAASGAYTFSGSSKSASSHQSQPAPTAERHGKGEAGARSCRAQPHPTASSAVRAGGLPAGPGSEDSHSSCSNTAKAFARSSGGQQQQHLGRGGGGGGAPQRRSMHLSALASGAAGASQQHPQRQQQQAAGGCATGDAEHLTTIAISTVDTELLEAAATQRPRAVLPTHVGSRGLYGGGMLCTVAGGGAPDSFELGARVSHEALAALQPSDVLAHIGAQPGQWLTVVIMEEMDRGSLHRSIHGGLLDATASHLSKRHRVRGMVRTLVEVAQGMAALHASGLVHGDLKPANVLLKAQTRDARGFVAKVSDLGCTRVMVEGVPAATVTTNDWGTVIYTAPEVFNGRSGPPSDVYSFGALTWHLTTGQLPHEDLNPFAVLLAVSKGDLELEWPRSVPKPLRRLGQLCMQHDPAARPTFAVIARALLKLEQRMKTQSAGAKSR